jgi:FtsP/CotA-like multicopper oxidase with cupredoxin domain
MKLLKSMAKSNGDKIFKANNNETFWLVNGLTQPVMKIRPGEWQRWRILFSFKGGNAGPLEIKLPDQCEMQLLAKDGVYIRDYPRKLSRTMIPTGGRADLMVRCHTVGNFKVSQEDVGVMHPLFQVNVEGPKIISDRLHKWRPEYPPYLSDLRYARVSQDECSCKLNFGSTDPACEYTCINDKQFDGSSDNAMVLGNVIERHLLNTSVHAYHQHVYPFQLIAGFEESEYFKLGDYHDTYFDHMVPTDRYVIIRFKPVDLTGKMVVHCHVLMHEDLGMMTLEDILPETTDDGTDNNCSCSDGYHGTLDDYFYTDNYYGFDRHMPQ